MRDGGWGLRGERLSEGATVTVNKRDGSTSTATVGRIVWRGEDGTCLATVARASSATTGGHRHGHQGGRCLCEDCGEWVDRGTKCWETGLRH